MLLKFASPVCCHSSFSFSQVLLCTFDPFLIIAVFAALYYLLQFRQVWTGVMRPHLRQWNRLCSEHRPPVPDLPLLPPVVMPGLSRAEARLPGEEDTLTENDAY